MPARKRLEDEERRNYTFFQSRNQGGLDTDAAESPKLDTPAVQKAREPEVPGEERETPVRRGELFRNMASRLEEGGGMRAPQVGRAAGPVSSKTEEEEVPTSKPGKIQDDPRFRDLDRAAQRRIEQSDNPEAALETATAKRAEPKMQEQEWFRGLEREEQKKYERGELERPDKAQPEPTRRLRPEVEAKMEEAGAKYVVGPNGETQVEAPDGTRYDIGEHGNLVKAAAGGEAGGLLRVPTTGRAAGPGAGSPEATWQARAQAAWEGVEKDAGPDYDELPIEEQRGRVAEKLSSQEKAAAAAGPVQRIVVQSATMPRSHELDGITRGTTVETPYGAVARDADTGEIRVTYSPFTEARMKEQEDKDMKAFGAWPGMEDPNAPRPRMRVGLRNFNPYSPNGWINNDNSVLEKYGR